MDIEKRLELVKGIAEEIITEKELRELLETNQNPIAYDGFEPSGLAHLPFGLYRAILLKDLLKAGIKFKLLLADLFAWINNKMQGDLDKIRLVGNYFVEVWKAAGIPIGKNVEILFSSEIVNKEYWKRVLLIAKNTTIARTTRCLTIMGRKEGELKEVAQYFYPLMQVSDVFQLEVDICQLGLDQRRASILARELAPKFDWKKPVIVSHHMLLGLQGIKAPEGYDENRLKDISIASKMSKSKPETSIFIHDSEAEIKRKISKAFCPEKQIENNPIIDYLIEIVFRIYREIEIERERKYGGNIVLGREELLESYKKGKIHPADLKNTASFYLNKLIKPIRDHFEKNKRAKKLYEFVKSQEITR